MKRALFFEVAGAIAKIGSGIKPNHHNITKFNQVKLVQIYDMYCTYDCKQTLYYTKGTVNVAIELKALTRLRGLVILMLIF